MGRFNLYMTRRKGDGSRLPILADAQIRYYSIALLIFDVTQIHLFARPGFTNDNLCVLRLSLLIALNQNSTSDTCSCVAMTPVTRIVGAISLWSVEIIMQLRIYALYGCSRKARPFSVNSSLLVLDLLTVHARSPPSMPLRFSDPSLGSCTSSYITPFTNALLSRMRSSTRSLVVPSFNPSSNGFNGFLVRQLSLQIHECCIHTSGAPATIYEGLLFFWAVYKAVESAVQLKQKNGRRSMFSLILVDNLVYFFGYVSPQSKSSQPHF